MTVNMEESTSTETRLEGGPDAQHRSLSASELLRPGGWGTRIFWVLYAILLGTATHLPLPPDAKPIILVWDKAIHFGAYFILAALTMLAFPATGEKKWLHVGVWIALFGLAAIDEITQPHVGRTADIKDWMCDAGGILLAVIGYILIRRYRGRNWSKRASIEADN